MLILEDDFEFTDQISKALSIALEKNNWDLFRLHGTALHQVARIENDVEHIIYENLIPPGSATGYLITPHGARRLVNYSVRFFKPVDDFIEDRWIHKLKIKSIYPFPIKTDIRFSTINDRAYVQLTSMQKIKREIFRIYPGIRRFIYRNYLRLY
jgi:glycosyl transferase family 25